MTMILPPEKLGDRVNIPPGVMGIPAAQRGGRPAIVGLLPEEPSTFINTMPRQKGPVLNNRDFNNMVDTGPGPVFRPEQVSVRGEPGPSFDPSTVDRLNEVTNGIMSSHQDLVEKINQQSGVIAFLMKSLIQDHPAADLQATQPTNNKPSAVSTGFL